jgi:HlyD family secretion protein
MGSLPDLLLTLRIAGQRHATMKRFLTYRPGKATLILSGAIVILFALISTSPDEISEPRKEKAWVVDVINAKSANLRPTLEIFGKVQSPQDAELSSAIEAVIVEMKVREGDSVAAGDILLVLDNRDATLSVKQAAADVKETEAQFRYARIRLAQSEQAFAKENELLSINTDRESRAQKIFSEGLLSQADVDTAMENLARQQLAVNQAELLVAETSAKLVELEARIEKLSALRERAELDLERTLLTAPFPGVISELQVSQGDRVRTGDTILRLQNPDSLEVRAQLPSRFARSIGEFMQEELDIPATVEIEGRRISGVVRRVSRQTRAGTGGVDSFIGFPYSTAGLRLGSTVRVVLELPPAQNVIAVPGEAIYGRDRIYKLTNERMEMIEVDRVGEREYSDGRTEVLLRSALLSDDDQIITTKLANAANGLLVKQNDQATPTDLITQTAENSEPTRPVDQ